VQRFQLNYSQVITGLLVQIFKETNDDRMWRFVPPVLLGASRYLQGQTVFEDTRLLQLVVLML
jgi:hypothetical protein